MHARLSLVLALSCLTACAKEQPNLAIVADGASFRFESAPDGSAVATASFVIRNRSPVVGFIRTCGGEPVVTVERAGPNGWEQYVADYCAAIVQPPLEVRYGGGVSGRSHIRLVGRYRLRLDYAASADLNTGYTALSAPFDVY